MRLASGGTITQCDTSEKWTLRFWVWISLRAKISPTSHLSMSLYNGPFSSSQVFEGPLNTSSYRKHEEDIQLLGRNSSTPASYSEDPGFKSRTGNYLDCDSSSFSSVTPGKCQYSISYLTLQPHVRFEVLTAMTMKNDVFWDVTPRGSCKNRRFGETLLLHHQGYKNRLTFPVHWFLSSWWWRH
jgi:hypothetical protein